MDKIDHDYLATLVRQRDRAQTTERESYKQGRIDEYCAQNAIVQSTVTDIDLRRFKKRLRG